MRVEPAAQLAHGRMGQRAISLSLNLGRRVHAGRPERWPSSKQPQAGRIQADLFGGASSTAHPASAACLPSPTNNHNGAAESVIVNSRYWLRSRQPRCRRLSSVFGGVLKGCGERDRIRIGRSGSAEGGCDQLPLRHSLDFPNERVELHHTHGPQTQHNWRDWTIHPDAPMETFTLPGRPFRDLTVRVFLKKICDVSPTCIRAQCVASFQPSTSRQTARAIRCHSRPNANQLSPPGAAQPCPSATPDT